MKIKMLISMMLLLGFSTGSINALSNDEALTVSFNKQSTKATTYDEKIKLNKDHLTLWKNAETNLSIAEEKLDRESYDLAKSAIDNIKYNLIKSNFQSRLDNVDSDIVALEELKRIEEEKAAQLAAIEEAEKEKIKKEQQQNKQNVEQSKQVVSTHESSNKSSVNTNNDSHKESSTSNDDKESTNKSNEKPSSNDSSKSNDGPVKMENVKKVGEGEITNYGGSGKSGSTYETGTFDLPADFNFPN